MILLQFHAQNNEINQLVVKKPIIINGYLKKNDHICCANCMLRAYTHLHFVGIKCKLFSRNNSNNNYFY